MFNLNKIFSIVLAATFLTGCYSPDESLFTKTTESESESESESDSENLDMIEYPHYQEDFDFDDYVISIGHLQIKDKQDPQQIQCDEEDEENGIECLEDDPDSEYSCEYNYFKATDWLDKFVATSPNSNTLFPGVIVRGDQARIGFIKPITELPRQKIIASVDIPNLKGPKSFEYDPEKVSSYREGLYEVLGAEIEGNVPSKFQLQMKRVFSQDDISIALGVNVEWAGNIVSNMFSFDKTVAKTQIVAVMTEAYYSVDIDLASNPHDYFTKPINEEDVKKEMYEDNPPLLIPSVTYGRRLIFNLTSSYSEEEMLEAFTAAYKFVVDAEASVSVNHQSILDETEIKVLVLGGENPSQVVGFEGLINFIVKGKGFNINDKGIPIGYRLSYLDGYDTKLSLTTEFALADCEKKKTPVVRINPESLNCPKNGQFIGAGHAYARVWAESSKEIKESQSNVIDFYNSLPDWIYLSDGSTISLSPDFKDFELEDLEKGDFVTFYMWVKEENKILNQSQTFIFDGEKWPEVSSKLHQKTGNLECYINFKVQNKI